MDLIAGRQEGTGKWFLTSQEFTSWVDGATRTLLCPGIPGAGKTYMTAIVVHHLRSRLLGHDIGIAVLYCSYRMRDEQKKEKLMGALLRQLVTPKHSALEVLQALVEQCKAEGRRPTFDELSKLIQHVFNAYTKVYVIIDALDECASVEWSPLMAELQRLQAMLPAVRLMVTFRPQIDVKNNFLAVSKLEIRADDGDLERYIDNNIMHLSKYVVENPTLKKDVIQGIIKAADGM